MEFWRVTPKLIGPVADLIDGTTLRLTYIAYVCTVHATEMARSLSPLSNFWGADISPPVLRVSSQSVGKSVS
jgi:hypothetical protein